MTDKAIIHKCTNQYPLWNRTAPRRKWTRKKSNLATLLSTPTHPINTRAIKHKRAEQAATRPKDRGTMSPGEMNSKQESSVHSRANSRTRTRLANSQSRRSNLLLHSWMTTIRRIWKQDLSKNSSRRLWWLRRRKAKVYKMYSNRFQTLFPTIASLPSQNKWPAILKS